MTRNSGKKTLHNNSFTDQTKNPNARWLALGQQRKYKIVLPFSRAIPTAIGF